MALYRTALAVGRTIINEFTGMEKFRELKRVRFGNVIPVARARVTACTMRHLSRAYKTKSKLQKSVRFKWRQISFGDSTSGDGSYKPNKPTSNGGVYKVQELSMLTQLLAKECSNCVHGDGAELHDNNLQTNNFVPQFQHRWLQLFVDNQSLLRKAEYMVEIVSIYPIFDEFDVELGPDELYNVTDYFEWDDQKSGGIYRRMIQRFSRRLVNQQPALTYEWIGCTAAQVLTEIEQQLSMLVQGLVKARSDAVDGDGAMALPWLRWTNELTTAVVLQMELNVHELDQSTVDFELTSDLVTERATSEMAPFQLLTKDPTSASASPLTILSLGHECSVCHLLVPGDDSTNVAQNFTCMSCGKSNLSVRVWLANPRHPLIREAQQQIELDLDRASKVVQRLDETTLTPVKSGSRVTYDSRIILVKQCTTPGCGEYCDAVSSSSQKCTRCSSALASEAGYFVINPTAILSSTLSQGLQVQPPTRQMLVMTA
jgi:hypothetical protein